VRFAQIERGVDVGLGNIVHVDEIPGNRAIDEGREFSGNPALDQRRDKPGSVLVRAVDGKEAEIRARKGFLLAVKTQQIRA